MIIQPTTIKITRKLRRPAWEGFSVQAWFPRRYEDSRLEIDENDETVGNKIRKAASEKTPYILVIGDKEIDSGELAIRQRGVVDLLKLKKDSFIQLLQEQIGQRQ